MCTLNDCEFCLPMLYMIRKRAYNNDVDKVMKFMKWHSHQRAPQKNNLISVSELDTCIAAAHFFMPCSKMLPLLLLLPAPPRCLSRSPNKMTFLTGMHRVCVRRFKGLLAMIVKLYLLLFPCL